MIGSLLLSAFVGLTPSASAADLTLPAVSPRAEVMQTVGVVEVTVNYSSPGKRERAIWGELVPYGELWRTGANAPTTFETTGDLTVGGKAVPAGTYGLLTLPGKDEWTVILNQNPAGGTGAYDEALDQARFTVVPEKGPARERLTFVFSDTHDDGANLDLEWDGVRVRLPIAVDTKATVSENLKSYTRRSSRELANGARYLADGGDHTGALEVIERSLQLERTWYNVWLKADFLHKKGSHKEAYKLAQAALELGNKAEGFFWKERVEKAVAEWPKK